MLDRLGKETVARVRRYASERGPDDTIVVQDVGHLSEAQMDSDGVALAKFIVTVVPLRTVGSMMRWLLEEYEWIIADDGY